MVLLENERNMLCQNAKWDNWASERIQLLNEIEKLGQRNMVLKMQMLKSGTTSSKRNLTEGQFSRHLAGFADNGGSHCFVGFIF
uniref:Uncharacterized protein n=1 Tax=Populus trichocarpa TaxID=3694 RepID=A0A2K2BU13_POPTR